MTWPAIYIDTETADYSTEDAPSLPVQIAAILAGEGRVVSTMSVLIDVRSWPGGRIRIATEKPGIQAHEITEQMTELFGWPAQIVVNRLMHMLMSARVMIAHNAVFDATVVQHAIRQICASPPDLPPLFCTMRESASIVRIPSTGRYSIDGWKAPKLTEAYRHFVGREMVGNHDALADVYACRAIHRGIMRHRERAASEVAV